MVKEFTYLMMVENIKVIMLIQKNKGLENIIGQMEKFIKVIGKMVNHKDKGNYLQNKK